MQHHMECMDQGNQYNEKNDLTKFYYILATKSSDSLKESFATILRTYSYAQTIF